MTRDDVERLRSDAAGRAENGDAPFHELTNRYSEMMPIR
jgi:hypothetical protein